MVASPRQRLILPLAPTGAGVAGVLIALVFAFMPTVTLESLAVDSGLASLVNAAQPPLGFTARAVLALGGGGVVSVLAWVALFVVVGSRSVIVQNPRATGDAGPALRRADVHPDAPPRQPVLANRDLGTPFLETRAAATPVERALPADLDMPLAAFDPQSFAAPAIAHIPDAAPARAPLPIRLDTGRALDLIAASMQHAPAPSADEEHAAEPAIAPMPIRLDTGHAIDLIAASMQQPMACAAEPDPDASIRALLDRLERSVARRETSPPAVPMRQARQESIRETLDTLRGLATRVG